MEAWLFQTCIDVIVITVKVSRGIVAFSPMGIDSAGGQWGDLHGKIAYTLPNNPARQ
jgi:hypothetical protein